MEYELYNRAVLEAERILKFYGGQSDKYKKACAKVNELDKLCFPIKEEEEAYQICEILKGKISQGAITAKELKPWCIAVGKNAVSEKAKAQYREFFKFINS